MTRSKRITAFRTHLENALSAARELQSYLPDDHAGIDSVVERIGTRIFCFDAKSLANKKHTRAHTTRETSALSLDAMDILREFPYDVGSIGRAANEMAAELLWASESFLS